MIDGFGCGGGRRRNHPTDRLTIQIYNPHAPHLHSCRLPGRDIFNERAAAPANTTTTQQEKKKPPKNKKGRTLFAHNNQQRVSSAAPSSWFSPSFALGLLVGTLGALSLVFGARQLGRVEGGGNGSRYRYASRFEGGGRHHVLP